MGKTPNSMFFGEVAGIAVQASEKGLDNTREKRLMIVTSTAGEMASIDVKRIVDNYNEYQTQNSS